MAKVSGAGRFVETLLGRSVTSRNPWLPDRIQVVATSDHRQGREVQRAGVRLVVWV